MNYPVYTREQVNAIYVTIPIDTKRDMRNKYSIQKTHGRLGRRAITELTPEEFCAIWWESGHWYERGKTLASYQMCRKGDSGNYAMGNVRIDTMRANLDDSSLNTSESMRVKRKDHTFCEKQVRAVKKALSIPVQATHVKTGEIRTWSSIADAARELNYSDGGISNAVSGKVKSAAGYTWNRM
jgi:hypothetical protein